MPLKKNPQKQSKPNLVQSIKEHFQGHSWLDNLLGNILWLVIGMACTGLLFFMTSSPSDAKEIRSTLLGLVKKEAAKHFGKDLKIEPVIDVFWSHEYFDNPTKTIVLAGTIAGKDNFQTRWIAIFEPDKQSFLDKVVSRSGFYKLASYSWMNVSDNDECRIDKISNPYLTKSGSEEFVVHLTSTWADSLSLGVLLFRKQDNGKWIVLSPLSCETLIAKVKDLYAHPSDPSEKIVRLFAPKKRKLSKIKPDINYLLSLTAYQEHYELFVDGEKKPIILLRNGGFFVLTNHPLQDYPQIIMGAPLYDDRDVVGSHYFVIGFLKIDKDRIIIDPDWNWGFPVFSRTPIHAGEIDLDALIDDGINAQKEGNIYFYGRGESKTGSSPSN